MSKTKQIALCGCFAALAVTVMLLAGVIPVATYCGPVLGAALLSPVLVACGRRLAWVWYVAVAVLTLLLCPDLECSLLFACVGYYPIIRQRLEKIRPRPLRLLGKLLVFNLAIGVMAVILGFVLGLEGLMREYLADGLWIFVLTYLLGNCTFLLTDQVLARLELLWHNRRGRRP